jgi:hypothetical protein
MRRPSTGGTIALTLTLTLALTLSLSLTLTLTRWDKAAEELAGAKPDFACPLVGPCDPGSGVGAGQALARGEAAGAHTTTPLKAVPPPKSVAASVGWAHPAGDRVHAPGSQAPTVQVRNPPYP